MRMTGAQIKAARALIGWSQRELAAAAGLHENSVAIWEAKASITVPKYGDGCGQRRIVRALTDAGVTFIAEPGPGVCLGSKPHFSASVKGLASRPHRPSSADFAAAPSALAGAMQ